MSTPIETAVAPDLMAQALSVLNTFLEQSPEAALALCSHRVVVTKEFADHESVQVQIAGDKFRVGLVGLLNGILEPCTGNRVAMITDNDRVVGFTEYKAPKSN